MKTFKFLSMTLIMVALSVCFASCNDDEDENEAEEVTLTGMWSQIYKTQNWRQTSYKHMAEPIKESVEAQTNSPWKADKHGDIKVTLIFNDNNLGTINHHKIFTDEKYDLNENFGYLSHNDTTLFIYGSSLEGVYKITVTRTELELKKENEEQTKTFYFERVYAY